MPIENNNEVSLKELREGFYRCRTFEVSNLWRRSFLLSIFQVLSFILYGLPASGLLNAAPGASNLLTLNQAAYAAALFGMSFAVIWIMMAKGSKAWYEVYERYIFEIEQAENDGLKIPARYRLGALCRPWEMNSNLFSKKAGRYSPSRLNITIGTVLLTTWFAVLVFHYAVSVVHYTNAEAAGAGHLLMLILIPSVFLTIALSALYNKWGRSRSLTETI